MKLKSAKYAAKMTWKEVENEFKSGTLIVIPVGAGCKEHGFHMPNNTDQVHAEFFAEKLAEQCDILIMPTVTYGFYPAFTNYAGSTSLSLNLCTQMFIEMCEQWNQQGARAFYFLNYGISTNKPLNAAQLELKEKKIPMAYTNINKYDKYLGQLPKGQKPEQEGGTHADEVETAIMLEIDSTLVEMELAEKDFDNKPGALLPFKPPEGSKDSYSPTGAWGDPTLATAEKGKVYVEKMIEFLLSDIKPYLNKNHLYEDNNNPGYKQTIK